MSGIACHPKLKNVSDFTKSFIIQKILEGLPITQPSVDIHHIRTFTQNNSGTPNICKSIYESTWFTSAYLLAYFVFLRIGELAITSDASQDKVLQLSVVSFANNIIQLLLKFSKTDQDGKGATIVIPIDIESLILQQALTNFH